MCIFSNCFFKLFLSRLWESLAIENSNVARVCVGLLMECVHFLAHNPSPSPVTATAAAKQQLPRPQHAHSVSAPVTATSSTPTTAAEEGEGLGGVVMGKVENVVEDGVLWKTLHKGLSAQNWITKFKTGVHKRITIQHSSLSLSLSLSSSLSPSLSLSPFLPPVERFSVLLQFMCSSEVVDIPFSEFQDSIQAAIGYGFCLLTQLLQDKNSNVCARAKFCISNISDISLKVHMYMYLYMYIYMYVHVPPGFWPGQDFLSVSGG